MMIGIIILSLICFLLCFLLFFSLRLNLKNAEKLDNLGNKIEECLDVLDMCYQRATTRSELEVFSDEPIVKELVEDIRLSRDAILLVANLLMEPLNDEEEQNGQ